MMRLKRFAALKHTLLLLTSLLVVLLGAQSALAQQGQRMMDPETRIKELIGALEITAEQEPAFRAAMGKVMAQQRESMRGMRQQGAGAGATAGAGAGGNAGAGGGADNAERMAQMQAIRAANQEQAKEHLAPVLTETQLDKFQELQAQQMPRRR